MSRKLDILKELIFKGKTLRDYRAYDWSDCNTNSLDMWITRETRGADYWKHAVSVYFVYIQRPLRDVEIYSYMSLSFMYDELFGIESDLGYSLNKEGGYEII